jgi:hypothetical protein
MNKYINLHNNLELYDKFLAKQFQQARGYINRIN